MVFEVNKNINVTQQNQWNAGKAAFIENFIALNADSRMENKKSESKFLSKLVKEQFKPEIIRRKEIRAKPMK